MQLFHVLGAILPILSIIEARQFPIPVVDAVVDGARRDFSKYIDHLPSPGSTNVTRRPNGFSTAAAGQAYWYEGIAHQGTSAFGAAGYRVYRNVKDFGARGKEAELIFFPSIRLTFLP